MPYIDVMWLVYDEYGYLVYDQGRPPEPGESWIPNVLEETRSPLGVMTVTHRRRVLPGTSFEKIEYLVKVVVNSHIPNIGKLFQ